jgi:hypothetical protein
MRDPNDPMTTTPPLSEGAQRGDAVSERTELMNRLRAIIDDATQSVRTLKEENAALARRARELEDRNGMLEQRLRLLTSGLSRDEQALRQSIDRLTQALRTPIEPPAAPESASGGSSPATAAPMNELADTREGTGPSPDAAEPTAPPPVAPQEPMGAPAATAAPENVAVAGSSERTSEAAPVAQPAAPAPEETDHAADTAAMPAVTTGGVYTLITYPFVRFSDLGQFQAALQRLQGVHDVQVRRFAQGTLEMTARYEGETNLITALRNLTTEIEEVREEAPYRLRIRLRARTDA